MAAGTLRAGGSLQSHLDRTRPLQLRQLSARPPAHKPSQPGWAIQDPGRHRAQGRRARGSVSPGSPLALAQATAPNRALLHLPTSGSALGTW